jgi:hypothetical protein
MSKFGDFEGSSHYKLIVCVVGCMSECRIWLSEDAVILSILILKVNNYAHF